jgi:hypothetical protein
VSPPRGQQCSLIDEIREIRADHAGCCGRDPAEVDVGRKGHAPCVHLEDRLAAGTVGRLHGDPAVEAAGSEQGRIEYVGPIGRSDDDHVRGGVEAVHLGQNLVQRLLAFVVATAEAGVTGRA